MTIQVRSTGTASERRRKAGKLLLVILCILICPYSWISAAQSSSQGKPSSNARGEYRFQVTDGESDLPVPGADICVSSMQKKGTNEVRKEIEVKTDKNGLAEFPRLEAHKLTVSVTAKGYRSYWRWIRTDAGSNPSRIRLERWAKSHK
jgi:Carboxypeptidase regulatory-like domain